MSREDTFMIKSEASFVISVIQLKLGFKEGIFYIQSSGNVGIF